MWGLDVSQCPPQPLFNRETKVSSLTGSLVLLIETGCKKVYSVVSKTCFGCQQTALTLQGAETSFSIKVMNCIKASLR